MREQGWKSFFFSSSREADVIMKIHHEYFEEREKLFWLGVDGKKFSWLIPRTTKKERKRNKVVGKTWKYGNEGENFLQGHFFDIC